MMRQDGSFGYAEYSGLQVLELPYSGNFLSMIVLLPKRIDGIRDLQNALTMENLNKWTDKTEKEEVLVMLPRLKLTYTVDLARALTNLGMPAAFDQFKADFSGMEDRHKDWLYISAVLHKAFINVNEEGTEAAAATAVVQMIGGEYSPPKVFRADHPFLFLIRDNRSGSILFLG